MRSACATLKLRFCELAGEHEDLADMLAVELYDPSEEGKLSMCLNFIPVTSSKAQSNLVSVFTIQTSKSI